MRLSKILLAVSLVAGFTCFGIEPTATLQTEFWQKAIDTAAARGGGTVVIPSGRHLTGELELRSNVTLHLAKGAVLEGVAGLENYRVRQLPFSEGTWSAIISAVGTTNVAVTGEGEIFGNGRIWNPPPGTKDAIGCTEGLRPRGLFFADCRDIRLENFRLRDAACWGIVFKRCDGILARGVKIDSCVNINNDGFDVEAKNVLIENCDVNCGDDALCIKSNDPNFVVENIVFRSTTARSHCNAIKLGTASHGTMRNIRFEKIRVAAPLRVYRDLAPMPTDLLNPPRIPGAPMYLSGPGISAISIECVDGGIVENITVEDVEVSGIKVPIFVRGGARQHRVCGIPPNDKRILRNILIKNVRGRAESYQPSSITGVPDCRPDDICLREIDIECVGEGENSKPFTEPGRKLDGGYPEATMFAKYRLPVYGLYIVDAGKVLLDDVRFTLRPGTHDTRPAYQHDRAFRGNPPTHADTLDR